MNWEHGFVTTCGLCGVIFCLIALVLYKFPPKKINRFYGYRTAKAMRSQERWDFAQQYAAVRMFEVGLVLLVLAFTAAWVITPGFYSQAGSRIALVLLVGGVAYMIIRTQRAIDKKFKE